MQYAYILVVDLPGGGGRCTRCERTYSIGPKLPPDVWVSALARTCIELFREYQAALATPDEPRNG